VYFGHFSDADENSSILLDKKIYITIWKITTWHIIILYIGFSRIYYINFRFVLTIRKVQYIRRLPILLYRVPNIINSIFIIIYTWFSFVKNWLIFLCMFTYLYFWYYTTTSSWYKLHVDIYHKLTIYNTVWLPCRYRIVLKWNVKLNKTSVAHR